MKRKLFYLIPVMCFLLVSTGTIAQSFSVSGTVKDSDTGEVIPGATVLEKGTNNGTITDIEGNYSLNVTDGTATLVISFVGFETKEIPLNGQSIANVELGISVTELGEIVVIGYGTQKKKVSTGAISSVDADQINSTPVLRVEQALQGRTAGVQVTNLSGQPGEQPTVRIRGAGTTGNAAPLYVVDGLVVGGIDYLNPGDIESIDVLKDAASAAIYGARAANGVVLITTKSGTKGRMSVRYDGYYGIQNVSKKIDMLNAEEYRMMMNEGARNAGLTEPFDLNEVPANDTDWQDALFQKNAPMVNHQISVEGGNDKSTYASSMAYFSQEGIIGGEKSQFDRYTARLNTTHKVNKYFNFGNNLAYSHIVRRGIGSNQSFNGAFSSAVNIDPLTPVFETEQTLLDQAPYSTQPVVTDENGNVYGISQLIGAEVVNPLALIENTHSETRVDKLVGNIYGEVVPIEGLKLRTSLGTDLAFVLNDGFTPVYYLNGAQSRDVSSVNKSIDRYFTWQWENTASYSKKIGSHNFNFLVGTTAQEVQYENLAGSNADVPTIDPDNVYLNLATDTLDEVGGGASHAALFSVFGRVTYDFKDKYSFTAILRRDGSSKFGPNNRYGIFPSLGAAWVITDEDFIPTLGPVDFLKLRASWGVNGNQEIGDYQFVSRIDQSRGYIFGSGRLVGASPFSVPNEDIQWEESTQLDIALDFGLYQSKLTGSLDYYVKTTGELLEVVAIPGHVGNAAPVANVGSVENQGVELSLNWQNAIGDLNYSIGANGSYNKNKVTKIGNENGYLVGASWAVAGAVTRAEEGFPIAYFYGYKTDGLFQSQSDVFAHIGSTGEPLQPAAQPGDVRFVDVDGDGAITPDDRTMIGNPTPDVTFGLTASADYKGFDFSMFIQGAAGHEIFNGMQRRDLRYTNLTTNALNRWTGEGTSTSIPRYTFVDTNNNNRVSDLYIESGSFARLKNIQIGYTLPQAFLERIKSTKWRFYVSVENLLTITDYSGADPEIGAMSSFDIGIDRAIYPQARTFRFGTSITF